MKSDLMIQMVLAHAEGEVGNVVTGGLPAIPGKTLWEKRDFLQSDGALRRLLLNEPRGGVFGHVNLLVPAISEKADFGFLIMEPEHTPPMSGSNLMCVATVLLETGMIPITGSVTEFTLESAAGLIPVRATTPDGRAKAIEFTNVASFADKLAVPLEIEGFPTQIVDTAFGGDSFVLVDAPGMGFALRPDEGRDLAELGAKITHAANEQIGFSHPTEVWNHISFCQWTTPVSQSQDGKTGLSAVIVDPGKIDRSPCGTGCSARLAVMHARDEIDVQEPYIGRSLIGGRFDCAIQSTTSIAGRKAIHPSIKGRGFVFGTSQIMRDPDDPWPEGYRLSDTWPVMPR